YRILGGSGQANRRRADDAAPALLRRRRDPDVAGIRRECLSRAEVASGFSRTSTPSGYPHVPALFTPAQPRRFVVQPQFSIFIAVASAIGKRRLYDDGDARCKGQCDLPALWAAANVI